MKWWQPSPPSSEIKPVPWLSPAVIQHLDNLVQPDWDIIEHGSGGSTLWFAARCKSVTAFEHNPDWQMIVKGQAPENATIYSRNDATSLTFNSFDLCLIDGEPVEDRRRWIEDAVQLVRPGGWVVLDNANRPEYAKERQHLQAYAAEFQTFDGNEGGTKYLVTEFFRMPEVVTEQPKKETKRARRSKS
jgi:predicted O-methyltransferase YrrM